MARLNHVQELSGAGWLLAMVLFNAGGLHFALSLLSFLTCLVNQWFMKLPLLIPKLWFRLESLHVKHINHRNGKSFAKTLSRAVCLFSPRVCICGRMVGERSWLMVKHLYLAMPKSPKTEQKPFSKQLEKADGSWSPWAAIPKREKQSNGFPNSMMKRLYVFLSSACNEYPTVIAYGLSTRRWYKFGSTWSWTGPKDCDKMGCQRNPSWLATRHLLKNFGHISQLWRDTTIQRTTWRRWRRLSAGHQGNSSTKATNRARDHWAQPHSHALQIMVSHLGTRTWQSRLTSAKDKQQTHPSNWFCIPQILWGHGNHSSVQQHWFPTKQLWRITVSTTSSPSSRRPAEHQQHYRATANHTSKAVVQAVASKASGISTRHSPAYSSQNQGSIEGLRRTLCGQVRILREHICTNYKTHVGMRHPSMPRPIKHSAFLLNNYLIHTGATTRYFRRWKPDSTVYMPATAVKQHPKLESCLYKGVWHGKDTPAGESYIGVPGKGIKARNIRIQVKPRKYDQQLTDVIIGSPWHQHHQHTTPGSS